MANGKIPPNAVNGKGCMPSTANSATFSAVICGIIRTARQQNIYAEEISRGKWQINSALAQFPIVGQPAGIMEEVSDFLIKI